MEFIFWKVVIGGLVAGAFALFGYILVDRQKFTAELKGLFDVCEKNRKECEKEKEQLRKDIFDLQKLVLRLAKKVDK